MYALTATRVAVSLVRPSLLRRFFLGRALRKCVWESVGYKREERRGGGRRKKEGTWKEMKVRKEKEGAENRRARANTHARTRTRQHTWWLEENVWDKKRKRDIERDRWLRWRGACGWRGKKKRERDREEASARLACLCRWSALCQRRNQQQPRNWGLRAGRMPACLPSAPGTLSPPPPPHSLSHPLILRVPPLAVSPPFSFFPPSFPFPQSWFHTSSHHPSRDHSINPASPTLHSPSLLLPSLACFSLYIVSFPLSNLSPSLYPRLFLWSAGIERCPVFSKSLCPNFSSLFSSHIYFFLPYTLAQPRALACLHTDPYSASRTNRHISPQRERREKPPFPCRAFPEQPLFSGKERDREREREREGENKLGVYLAPHQAASVSLPNGAALVTCNPTSIARRAPSLAGCCTPLSFSLSLSPLSLPLSLSLSLYLCRRPSQLPLRSDQYFHGKETETRALS